MTGLDNSCAGPDPPALAEGLRRDLVGVVDPAQVFMMWRPAARFAMGPFPPARFADRFRASTILEPLVRFAMSSPVTAHYFQSASSRFERAGGREPHRTADEGAATSEAGGSRTRPGAARRAIPAAEQLGPGGDASSTRTAFPPRGARPESRFRVTGPGLLDEIEGDEVAPVGKREQVEGRSSGSASRARVGEDHHLDGDVGLELVLVAH
jgi:hypothetical protein